MIEVESGAGAGSSPSTKRAGDGAIALGTGACTHPGVGVGGGANQWDSINKMGFFSRLSESILDERGNVSLVQCRNKILMLYLLRLLYHIT